MSIKYAAAQAASGLLTWGLHTMAKRPGATLPGVAALKIDPDILIHARARMRQGCIITVGTNGKTTVNNLLASVLERTGHSVICNRTGANMAGGIVSALLQNYPSDWGVLECDELWLAKILPSLQADYVLLLNLFRDQLDRCGEIDRVQDSIVDALERSPRTALIYNADDPLCAMVAKRAGNRESTGNVTFGLSECLNLTQNAVADATMCQACSHMFHYEFRQYGQLGAYVCPHCGFTRPPLDFAAKDVEFTAESLSFTVAENGSGELDAKTHPPRDFPLKTKLVGSYMAYNLLGVASAARMIGCPSETIQESIADFDPKNGRLQEYRIKGRRILLNLAKNPTGFNQNLRIVAADEKPHAVAFFINDKVVDGHDISWIWDIDFEELGATPNTLVFAGGVRRNDLQVRLKYAGIQAQLIDSIEDVFRIADEKLPSDASVYAIANYTALPEVKAVLDALEGAPATDETSDAASLAPSASPATDASSETASPMTPTAAESPNVSRETFVRNEAPFDLSKPLVIAHMLPDLLNLYGDGGNVRILQKRLEWRGLPVEVRPIRYGDPLDLDEVDLVFLGGGPDREQTLASKQLLAMRDDLARFIEEDGVVLAICGGYQILGHTWLLGDEEVPGLGILNMETRRPGTSADRLVANIALDTPMTTSPVIGYENHASRTYLGEDLEPFGRVVSTVGKGNTDVGPGSFADGVLYKSLIGTYLHGPLLSKNPAVADWLLVRAVAHWAKRIGLAAVPVLEALPDDEEEDANWFMAQQLTS